MNTNFMFLQEHFPALEKMGSLAEAYLFSDPNACLYKMGSLAETIVNYIFELDGYKPPASNNTHANRIIVLQREGILPKEINDILYIIRIKRNEAVHEGYESFEVCETLLQMSHTLAVWFMQIYGDDQYEPADFVMPLDIRNQDGYLQLLEENEKLVAELEKTQAAALSKLLHLRMHAAKRKQLAEKAARDLKLTERTTRYLIDEQLRKVGWEADSKNLRYAKGTRPEAGRNIAIANWPTDPAICAWGNMDYALFAGLKLIGVVEAKATHKNIETLINQQCRDYSKGVKDEHLEYVIDAQNIYRSPFLFATNGRPYQQQSETKSGIWFGDTREGGQAPKVLQGWVSPQGLLDMLDFNIDAANQKLAESSFSPLRDNEGLNLRPYQIEAIKKAEAAIVAGQKNVLLAMADGAGKTRTMLGMMYRFLKTGRFKKILFLIDRTDLSEQVLETFKEVRIEDLLTLWQLYDIRDFAGQNSKQDAKIQVDTVQNLVRRIIYNDAETMPSVMEYDLIVIDDAHRSSTVELKESDNELLYQSQPDYLNKYRTILEYFDAIKVALTATPVPHSAEIFGSPVFTYNDPTGDAKVAVQLEEAIRLIRVAVGELTK